MKELIAVTEASYHSGHRLRLRFSDGCEKIVDFTPWLRGEVFKPLRDVKFFKKFFIGGGTVCWPNGADVAPETLYEAHDVSATAA
ncbi:MAG: DUF2442 domain-containing protein [Acidobacteriota bacterium]|nr:DUF2442 domain-containing protein [Acidobacteriota bacterium]